MADKKDLREVRLSGSWGVIDFYVLEGTVLRGVNTAFLSLPVAEFLRENFSSCLLKSVKGVGDDGFEYNTDPFVLDENGLVETLFEFEDVGVKYVNLNDDPLED